ncbi:hypothetical protein [Methylovulum miyakonense]|uniref:hypothetical protein n=1 Tax=Methylovulum miyakonense TaxID=645578 RepID=UPI0003708BB2|nr:hypothetical protein [Methylovulum miyakonense]
MNNYNLTSIQEKNGNCYLQTSFYQLPVCVSKELIERVLENDLLENIHDILKSGKVELFWVDEKQNMIFIDRLLSKNPDASFLPNGLKDQILNASLRKQPYSFFIERGISQNSRGLFEMKLRLSCEAKPHKKGFKHGYKLSIVAGTSLFLLLVDSDLKIVSVTEKEEYILPNKAFIKPEITGREN